MRTSKKSLDAVKERISGKGIRADDIKYEDRLTEEQISEIPDETVFQWVQEKRWTVKDFRKWLDSFSTNE